MEKELYDDMHRQERTHWWFQARREIITDIVLAAPPDAMTAKRKLLDVGCGTGFILERLKAWYDVYGLDHAEVAVAYCKQRSLLNVRQGVLGGENFETRFDMILFPAVLAVRVLGKLFGRRNASDTWHPGKRLNQLLYTLFSLKRKLLPKITLPFDVSLLCLAEKAAIRTEETSPPDFATVSETPAAA
ncbi:MAG: class I SAM-dependent methyltransferase [Rhizobacter sp.]|nr:class I SAM-dependent methyltransferase [Chlorobiales bacterium]